MSLLCLNVSGQDSFALDSAALWAKIISLEGRYLADFPTTFATVEDLLQEAQRSGCTGCKGRAIMLMGEFYWANGAYQQGLKFFRSAIEVARLVKDYNTMAKATDFIANTYYYQAYYDSAEYYFNKAYKIAEDEGDIANMILILHNTSLMYHRKGDFRRTVEYIFKGEKLKDELPETKHHIEAMGAMGSLMIDSIYYKEEIKDELKNVDLYKRSGEWMKLYYTYHNIGKSYRQLQDPLNAAKYFRLAAKTGEFIELVPEWDLVAIDYRNAGMKDSCFYYHYLAKQDFNRVTRPNASYTLELLGSAHMAFGNLDSARFYYDSALAMSYKMNNRITFTGIHRNLVRTHALRGDFQSAKYHLSTGLRLAREVSLIHEKNLYQEGQFLHEQMGDYKTALFYSEKYKNYLDSINRQETAINLTRMQAEFKTAKKESELSQMIQVNLLNEEKIKTRNLQIGLALISIILIGSFGGLYYRRFRRKEKGSNLLQRQKQIIEQQNDVLQKQNEEKEALIHEIHHRVKNNLQIISSLINIKARSGDEETKDILGGLNNRIHSLGLVHEMLYKSDHFGSIDLKEYLTEQSRLTLASLELNKGGIVLEVEIDKVEANVDSALALGLISNELITNAIKYAFDTTQQVKTIGVKLKKSLGQWVFSVTDNGLRSSSFDFKSGKSFGLKFVDQLLKTKLNGQMNIKQDQGMKIEMVLKLTV